MFREIMNWFMLNYEWYLLVGFMFSMLHYYKIKRQIAQNNKRLFSYKMKTTKLFLPLVLLRIPFYPVFIVLGLLDAFANWE